MSRERWMAVCFAAGSMSFLITPYSGFRSLVGAAADSVTLFSGSVLFTAGGALQSSLAFPERHPADGEPAAWRAAGIQYAGTLLFNLTTYRAIHGALHHADDHKRVWRPDTLGSICFLMSGAIADHASTRRGWLLARGSSGWCSQRSTSSAASSSASQPRPATSPHPPAGRTGRP